jgi:TonB family protein
MDHLEPLPASYEDDALALEVAVLDRCPSSTTTGLRQVEFRAIALDDRTVQLSYVNNWDLALGFREMPVWRDIVDATDLIAWADSIEPRVASFDTTSASRSWGPSFVPGAPLLGYSGARGIRVGLTTFGALQGGIFCGVAEAGLLIERKELPRIAALVRRVAREALSRSPQPSGDRVYSENEVACAVTPLGGNPDPKYPSGIPANERMSAEVLVTFVVDTLGVPDSASVHAMPGSDPRFSSAAEQSVRTWRFSPALRGGKRVRQLTHLPVILRPDDGNAARSAVAVGGRAPVAHPPLSGRPSTPAPTVFSRPTSPRSSRRGTAEVRTEPRPTEFEALERLEQAMQPYVEMARATYPDARKRFIAGLPRGYDFYLTTRLRDPQGRWEQIFVRTDSIARGRVYGQISSDVRLIAGYRAFQSYQFPETDLIDWTITDPRGREEGNALGKFLDAQGASSKNPR